MNISKINTRSADSLLLVYLDMDTPLLINGYNSDRNSTEQVTGW